MLKQMMADAVVCFFLALHKFDFLALSTMKPVSDNLVNWFYKYHGADFIGQLVLINEND